MTNYTSEDLIKYLYKESSAAQSEAIEKAMQSDWDLRDEYNALKESMQQLDTLIESPRPESVKAILDYARTPSEVVQPS